MLSLDSLEMILDVLILLVTSVVGNLLCVLHSLLKSCGVRTFGQRKGSLAQSKVCLGVVWINFEDTFALVNGLLILLRENFALGEIITTCNLKVLALSRFGCLFILFELIYGSEVLGRCISVILSLKEFICFLLNLICFL